MALQVYTNYYSVTAQKNLSKADDGMAKAVTRLSSGMRINNASDDVAGIAVSDKLRTQVRGMEKATYNAQDAISMLQTAEASMETITDLIQRMRELAVQAGNGVYTATDRQQLQKEVEQLKLEVDRIAVATEYNTKKLLNGNAAGYWSSDSADIEAIFNGIPVEGNYKLEFNTEPGQNAIYKSHKFQDRFYNLYEPELPDGIKNIEVDGIDKGNIIWTINDDSVSNPPYQTGGYWYYHNQNAIYSGNFDMPDIADFVAVEDYSGPHQFEYPAYNFPGYYVGIERVVYDGQAVYNQGGVPSGGEVPNSTASLDYFLDTEGHKVFKTEENARVLAQNAPNHTTDATEGYYQVFFLDPSTGEKHYADYVRANAADTYVAYIRKQPIGELPDAQDGSPLEIHLNRDLVRNAMTDDSKVVFFHQASSPDSHSQTSAPDAEYPGHPPASNYKTVNIQITTPDGTKEFGDDLSVNVFWDMMSPDRANFTALTIVDGEFQTIDIKWERDWDIPDDGVGGVYRIPPLEIFRPDTVPLRNFDTFTQSDGRMILDNTLGLTVYGNGREANIHIDAGDTLQDLVEKLSHAIGTELKMGATGVPERDLVKIVTSSETIKSTGINAIPGTMIIQTALTGRASELRFAGSEELLNALGLTQLQASSENKTTISVTDAHTGRLIGVGSASDGTLRSVIGGVDIKFDPQSNVNVRYNEVTAKMVFTPDNNRTAYLHVVQNTADVQVGVNEGQLFDVVVGRVDTYSLGIDDADIMSMQDSQVAITKFDQALEKVTKIRSQIGSQIQRIEYTMKNLNISKQNAEVAESRIRDLDVAEESATFAKDQVLLNAATAMLAQANQLPQTALTLIGR